MSALVYALLGSSGGLIAGGAGVWTASSRRLKERRIQAARNVEAELEAKDRTIATNEQTITSLEKRVDDLETTVASLKTALETATTAVTSLEARYGILQEFAAPRAFHSIDTKLDGLLQKLLDPAEQAAVAAKLGDPSIPPRAARR